MPNNHIDSKKVDSDGNIEIGAKVSAETQVYNDTLQEDKKNDYLTKISSKTYESDSSEEYNNNPFADPVVAAYYRDVYEKAKYECRAAYDPEFEWTEEEERSLIRKLDWRVSLSSCIMFIALQVDRGNLSQAASDNFLKDLNLNTNDYNTGNIVFLVCFLLAEIPSQLISKALGPDVFIPFQICAWSIVAITQAALKNKAGFIVTRALLGALEGGFIADLVLWLSYFYKRKELPIRLAYFWTSLSVCQILTSLLAFGILRMRGVHGMAGWRWLFLIEGLFTLTIGIVSYFFLMVPSACQTKKPWNKKGWFNDREVKIVVNRVLRDDPTKGDMHNRQALTFSQIWKSLQDYDLWPLYFLGLIFNIPVTTAAPYLTLNLRQLGFSTFNTNLLTIPCNVIHIIFLILITWYSEIVNDRLWVSLALPLYSVPLLAVMRWWPGSMVQAWPTWVVTTLFLGGPYIHAMNVSLCSRNAGSVRSRSISAAVYNMFVQLGGIASNNIYREDDRPLYHRGNMQLFAIAVATIPVIVLNKLYYIRRNKLRESKWNALTPEEREEYIKTTKDEGNKRLDFRFDH